MKKRIFAWIMICVLIISGMGVDWNSAEDGASTGGASQAGDPQTQSGAQTQPGGSSPSGAEWSASCFDVTGSEVTGLSEQGKAMLASKGGALVFPADLTATAVAEEAFRGNQEIVEVQFGDQIRTIGNEAFMGCSNLKTVSIENVSSIGDKAFYQCGIEGTITIHNGMSKIGDSAFAQNHISEVQVPPRNGESGYVDVGLYAFRGNRITKADLSNFERIHGIFRDSAHKEQKVIPRGMFMDNLVSEIIFPTYYVRIGQECFRNNALEELTIPNHLTNVFFNAFQENRKLRKLILVEGGSEKYQIDRQGFFDCAIEEIENIHLLREIGGASFGKNRLTALDIPNINVFGYLSFLANPLERVRVVKTTGIFEAGVFKNTKLKNVSLNEFKITSNYSWVETFQNAKLKSIDFPAYIDLSAILTYGNGATDIMCKNMFDGNPGWHSKTDLVALYRKNFETGEYDVGNLFGDITEGHFLVNPVLLNLEVKDEGGSAVSAPGAVKFSISRTANGAPVTKEVSVSDEDYLNFKLGDKATFEIPVIDGYEFVGATGTKKDAVEGSPVTYEIDLSPNNVADKSYGDGYEVGYKQFTVTLNYKKIGGGSSVSPGDTEPETTPDTTPETTTTTAPVTTVTITTTATTATETVTPVAAEETTDAAVTTAPVGDSEEETSEEIVIDRVQPVERKTLEFIQIEEDIPLGVVTTAPLDLEELLMFDEDVPLGVILADNTIPYVASTALPYTGGIGNEFFIGFGLLLIAFGVVIRKQR